MSKIKVSFSFLLTLVLVGMFSAIAFAAAPNAPTGLKAELEKIKSTTATGQNVTEYDLDLTWTAVNGATSYDVYLNGTLKENVTVLEYTFTGIEEETSIEVAAVNSDGTSAKTAFAWNAEVNVTKAVDDDENDNSLVNANQTGLGVGGQGENYSGAIKSGGMTNKDGTNSTHKTHGDYANNTNSCASCHQTHTAASKNLLFKNGVYATCTACHDGTLGFYNVFATGTDASKSAGTFGGSEDGNMSVHMATGAVAIKAAPGGNKTGEGSWAGEFTCASCHAPHGSFSDRLLHYNPNGIATTPVADGGQKLENVAIVDAPVPTVKTDDNIIVRTKNLTAQQITDNKFFGLNAGASVVQLYKWNGTAYALDSTPWVYTGTYDATHTYKVYDTALWKVKDSSTEAKKYNTAVATSGFIAPGKNTGKLVSRQNFIGANPGVIATTTGAISDVALLDQATVADIARAYVVDLDLTPVADATLAAKNVTETKVDSLWNGLVWNETGAKKSGKGVVMSGFCSACHTDYLAKSGSESGTYSHAYRHTTTSDSYSCVRCHFAHGTDVTVMKDAQGKTAQQLVADHDVADLTTAKAYLLDKAPSSALKRYTNMSVCWGCHTSSHAEGLRNDQGYGNDSDDPILGLEPGM
jgi:predicted CXXCH cytochrome family protein